MKVRLIIIMMGLVVQAQATTLPEAIALARKHNAPYQQQTQQLLGSAYDLSVAIEARQPQWHWQSKADTYHDRDEQHPRQAHTAQSALALSYKLPWGSTVQGRLAEQLTQGTTRNTQTQGSIDWRTPLAQGYGRAVNDIPTKQARYDYAQQEVSLRQADIDLALQVSLQYREVQQHLLQQQTQSALLAQAEENLSRTCARIEAGRVPAAEANQFALALNVQEQQYNQLAMARAQAQARLDLMVGAPVEVLDTLTSTDTIAPIAHYLDYALAHHPLILQIQWQAAGLGLQQRRAQDEQRWQIDWVGRLSVAGAHPDVGRAMQDFVRNREGHYYTGIEMQVPLGQKKRLGQAQYHYQLALQQQALQADYTRAQLKIAIETAWQNVHLQDAQYTLARSTAALAEASVIHAFEKYEAGRTAAYEWVHLQQQAAAAQRDVIAAHIMALNARTQLKAASGELG